ncbi:MAG: ADP-ribosylglycohydrolase family protein [Clostridia bacterium]|nr:ADP-ribosylglycohydrolase family protein [Clostridia bacterium]
MMKKLNSTELKDKIQGCWEGKNIGGVFGAPFEMYRGLVDAKFYTQDLSASIPPNDDLDLQLIWLNAAEKYGTALNSDILAEFWTSFEIANCGEYGTAKENLKCGILPPLSGMIGNHMHNSNGAFIRSEIWACLFPGNPEKAVRYSYEDAIVDHAEEGVYAAAFCTALESAAFFENNVNKLIEIGRSYIPESSKVGEAIKMVKEMYEDNKTIEEIRVALLTDFPSYFGIYNVHPYEIKENFPLGDDLGLDAPVQLGIITAALLFGQGDFEKTLITAVHCGEDADCTAATVGAILGIINGKANLPDKWVKPLGNKIETLCINLALGGAINVPKNTFELTDRVMRLLPVFNDNDRCMIDECGITVFAEEQIPYSMRDLYFKGNYGMEDIKIHEYLSFAPYKKLYKNPVFNTVIDYGGEPFVSTGDTVKLGVTLYNQNMDRVKHCVCVKVIADNGVTLNTNKYMRVMTSNNYEMKSELSVEFTVGECNTPYIDLYLDITVEGRSTVQLIKCRYFFK